MFCATSLFSFEFFPDETENHKKATKEWRENKEVRGKLLSEIKKLSIGTPEYKAYKLAVEKTEISYEKLKKDPDFTIVGYVADSSEENSFIASDGSFHKLIAQGWDSTQD